MTSTFVKNGEKLVIIGDSAIAQVAYEYFTVDSPYEVVAFAVERAYLKRDRLFDVPVVALEDLPKLYPPAQHRAFVAVGYGLMNRLRERLFREAKAKGYVLASFISPRAFVWRNVSIGENAFIFENNVVQPFVTIGDNVTLWSGNHIGHHVRVGHHVFISSHVVLSGHVEVGDYSFLGVNATVAHGVKIGANVVLGAAATILRNTEARRFYVAGETAPRPVDTLAYYGIEAGA